ncbi:hypothetical protein EC988_001823 [Linderina pennispora]|nr:hypothetical protein EC988_001823 [Linderina pennispora]
MDIYSYFSVKDKSFVITGGGAGLGRMMAEGLVAAGAHVYIASRNEQILKETSQSLTAQGPGKCDYIVCDITDSEQVQELAHKLTELEPNGLHALINNCGRTYVANYKEHPDDEFLSTLQLNMFTPFLVSKTLLPLLKRAATKERPARIINITSIAGYRICVSTHPAYISSKAGLIHLTKDMAQKFAPDNITVNSISPGSFDSPMLRDSLPEDFFMQMPDLVPLRRLGNTIDITGTVVFLASDAGSYITGTDTILDGGVLVA